MVKALILEMVNDKEGTDENVFGRKIRTNAISLEAPANRIRWFDAMFSFSTGEAITGNDLEANLRLIC